MYEPGLAGGAFVLRGAGHSLGTAFYLSGGAISSLTFGDVTPRGGLDRALVDLATIVGLTTFTLASATSSRRSACSVRSRTCTVRCAGFHTRRLRRSSP